MYDKMSMLMKVKKVLVVGGAGYIGGSVTEVLASEKIPFSVYDNLTYERDYLKKVDFIYGDIRDQDKLKKILPNYSHVIWLAALVGDGACALQPRVSKQLNALCPGWMSRHFKGRILFTSTCSVYGQHDSWLDENSPVAPLSVYAKTKLAAENYLKGKNALIFRLGTAYGLSDDFSRLRLDLAVNYMAALAVKIGKLYVFGGQQWRPFIHVQDIARALVTALAKDNTGIFNLATDNMQIRDLAKIIQAKTDCKIEFTPQKFQDQRNYHVKTEKAKKANLIPFKSKKIIDGVTEIIPLIKEDRIKSIDDEVYSNAKYLKRIYDKNYWI